MNIFIVGLSNGYIPNEHPEWGITEVSRAKSEQYWRFDRLFVICPSISQVINARENCHQPVAEASFWSRLVGLMISFKGKKSL